MSRDIPFFEMFTELRLSAPLRLKLAGAELTGACIDQTAMTITVHLRVRMPLSPEDEEQIRQSLCAVYGFTKAELDVTCVEQPAAKGAAPGIFVLCAQREGKRQALRKGPDGQPHQDQARSHEDAGSEDGQRHGSRKGVRL